MMKKIFSLILCGALAFIGLQSCGTAEKGAAKSIKSVEKISVEAPVGTVPRLPYQLWVTYNDGTGSYRQVRWSNAALAVEKEQSDPALYPVGKKYTIEGHITGDNTTPKGYPVTAKVRVVADQYEVPGNVFKAQPLPLDKVVINGDNRLTSNRDMLIEQVIFIPLERQRIAVTAGHFQKPVDGLRLAGGGFG